MSRDDLERRRGLTFAQAEGAAPIPQQLDRTAMPPRLRSRLWKAVEWYIGKVMSEGDSDYFINDQLYATIEYYHIDTNQSFSAPFSNDVDEVKFYVRGVYETGSYVNVYDLTQRLIQFDREEKTLARIIDAMLSSELSSYRVFDDSIIAPIASEQEAETVARAFDELGKAGAVGARQHIRNAIELLNSSRFGDSVRESINAVESIAKVLSSEPKTELAGALSVLEKTSNIHGGMRRAFAALYGYTSDRDGIRHSLLYGNEAKVDEADALFMIGACSAFVTYLISRARDAGISIKSTE